MNDRFKFRAWNKDKNIMVYNNEDNKSTYWDGVVANDVQIVNDRFNSTDYLVWMQYTNIKDINLLLIYEYDIVKDNNNNIYLIIYDTLYFKLMAEEIRSKKVIDIWELSKYQPELIGNRFENIELLSR